MGHCEFVQGSNMDINSAAVLPMWWRHVAARNRVPQETFYVAILTDFQPYFRYGRSSNFWVAYGLPRILNGP